MPDNDEFPDIDGIVAGQFDVSDVDADALGDMETPDSPDAEEEGAEHHFRDKETDRDQAQHKEAEPPIGAMTVETLFLGAMAADESHVNAGTIKAFLTKSSAIDSASSGVREMLRDSFFDAHDEEKDKESAFSVDDQMSQEQAEVQKARALNQQVKIANIMKKLAIVNVLRRQLRELQHDM